MLVAPSSDGRPAYTQVVRVFRQKRRCEVCGETVGRTEKALEASRLQLDGSRTRIALHESCWGANKVTRTTRLEPVEVRFANRTAKPS